MINTIFYFVDDFDTYQLKVLQHDISAKTIVFVEDQLAIYKDGKRYGNMGYDDIKQKVIEVITNDEDGQEAVNHTYDDSHLIDALNRIDEITRAEQRRLSDLIMELDGEIQDKVNRMFDDAQWIRENVAQNEYLHQDMTWIGGEINAYLQQVGYWTTDTQGNTITQWSKIQQAVDSISTNVNALTENVDGRFTAVLSAINQSVDQKIQTAKTEISNMYASGQDVSGVKLVLEWMYSGLRSSAGPELSIAQIVAAGKNSLIGAISDMRTQVNKLENGDYVSTASLTTQIESYITGQLSTAGLITETTLADAFSTVFSRLDDPNNSGTSGISALETRVQALEQGGFISETNLVSAITNHKADIIAGAGLATKAQYDALGNTYLAKADLVTEITNKAGLIASSAGLMLSTGLDSAVADLVANTSSTRAAILVIATGNNSSITVNADDINMDANHKLSLNADYLTVASNFYSTVANNITLTADKVTIDAQHQLNLGNLDLSGLTINANQINIDAQHLLDLSSLNLSIAGDQITMSSSHPLALNTTGVTVNGQPFFNAIENRLDVGTVVTNQLESGTGTFKGNVEAKTFTAGQLGEPGIVVISGTFDPNAATDHSKMYFAYDPSQNAPNLYVWDNTADPNNNNDPIGWRSLSFANAMKSDTYFASTGWYIYTGNADHYIKKSATSLSTSDFTPVTLYISQDDNCYYDSNNSLNAALVSGMYYRDCYNDNSTPSIYDSMFDDAVSEINSNDLTNLPSFLLLEVDPVTNKYIAAEIHCIYNLRGYVTNNAVLHSLVDNNIQSPINLQLGITTKPTLSDCAQGIMYCNDAVINYTKDPSTGEITSITRGFAFVRDSSTNNGGGDIIGTVISKTNKVYSTLNLIRDDNVYSYINAYTKVSTAGDASYGQWRNPGGGNLSSDIGSATLEYTIPSAS